jgi:hypothetical protein
MKGKRTKGNHMQIFELYFLHCTVDHPKAQFTDLVSIC